MNNENHRTVVTEVGGSHFTAWRSLFSGWEVWR
jgi:hypothetical protein